MVTVHQHLSGTAPVQSGSFSLLCSEGPGVAVGFAYAKASASWFLLYPASIYVLQGQESLYKAARSWTSSPGASKIPQMCWDQLHTRLGLPRNVCF